MRHSLLALVTALSLTVLGCGDDSTSAQMDMTIDAKAPTGDGGLPALSCGDLITCDNACNTPSCSTACVKKATTTAQSLYKALGDCIDKVCPQSELGDGGTAVACSYDSVGNYIDQAACDACVMKSQDAGGACEAQLTACSNDGV